MSETLMREYYQTYNSEDPERLASFYHPEAELHSSQGVMRGREEILATYRYLIATFRDQMEPTHVGIDGATATVEITDRLTAREKVDFMGTSLKPGETLTLELRGTYRIVDGQFRHILIEAR